MATKNLKKPAACIFRIEERDDIKEMGDSRFLQNFGTHLPKTA
jgi:hypothetical protein